MKLWQLAHSRTGDKGDTSNISVIVYDIANYDKLSHKLTVEKVYQQLLSAINHYGATQVNIERFDLPKLGAFNFVIHGILKGGVTRSLSLDAHGKSLCSLLLDMEVE